MCAATAAQRSERSGGGGPAARRALPEDVPARTWLIEMKARSQAAHRKASRRLSSLCTCRSAGGPWAWLWAHLWRLGRESGRLSPLAAWRTAQEPSGDAQRPQELPSVGRRGQHRPSALKLRRRPRGGTSGLSAQGSHLTLALLGPCAPRGVQRRAPLSCVRRREFLLAASEAVPAWRLARRRACPRAAS